jgi:hypothetical protein
VTEPSDQVNRADVQALWSLGIDGAVPWDGLVLKRRFIQRAEPLRQRVIEVCRQALR